MAPVNKPRFQDYIEQLRQAGRLSDYAPTPEPKFPDYLSQMRKKYGVGSGFDLDLMKATLTGGGTTGSNWGSAPGKFGAFVNAMRAQESGSPKGNYGLVNRDSGALGAYQIMPFNIGPWSKQILGRSISTQEFLRNRALQDRIAQGMLKRYVNKYGYQGAASAWYSGSPTKWKTSTGMQSGGYPSVRNYVNTVIKRMQGYL